MAEEITNENKKIPDLERETLSFWKEHRIFEKSVEKNSPDNLYVFYDGPPFISGLPHYGHLLGSISKDIIPRYQTMKGKRVERVWGWDAHGLSVENKVQKKIGIKNRRDIEKYGLEKFTQECYRYTSEVSAEWEWYIDRIGRWVDLKNAYRTTDQSYMETVIWVFKQLYDKGYIYEGVRTSLYCTTCGTPVSNFEVAMDNSYKDMEDPSIIVKFPISTKGKYFGINVLAWTTTPWTIPSNRGLVVDSNEAYVICEKEGEKYILAEKRLDFIFRDEKYSILEKLKGKDLLHLEYNAPYTFFKKGPNDFKIYEYEGMVTMDDGTGIVHSAPGFGEIDTEMGISKGLSVMMTIDDEGRFIQGDNGENPFFGIYYSEANIKIIDDMTKRNILFSNEKIVHRFPYHDRCDTPLIQKTQKSWFIRVSDAKDIMLSTNKNINWVPEYIKEGRYKQGIEQAPDWCISRNRFWATPMPVWESEDGERIVVSSIKEIEELSGKKVTDLHRPYIDQITFIKDGKHFKRIPEVLDCWMESGSMPFAQYHYPFNNKEKFEKNYPGDYVSEYVPQVRAWFYVMHVLSALVFHSHPFKNVIVTGIMAGSDGRKMSKTYENYTDPKEVLEKYGGDALRLYLTDSPLMSAENANFDEEVLKTKLRNVLNPLWNSMKFLLLYLKQYDWNEDKFIESDNILDKWIILRLNQLIKNIEENLDKYLIQQASAEIDVFVDDLSRWYVRRSRERISQGDNEAISTLFYVIKNFSLATAPLIPFLTESIYQSLKTYLTKDQKESVHLCNYPDYDKEFLKNNIDIQEKMKIVRELVSDALALRVEKGVGVRQPLNSIAVLNEHIIPEDFEILIKEEVNVKNIQYLSSLDEKPTYVKESKGRVSLDFTLTDSLKAEGAARELVREIQDIRKKLGLSISDQIDAIYKNTPENNKAVSLFEEEIKKKVLARNLSSGTETSISRV
ncbi:MAG TPA: isoleucine--tRNA ligase [bacterium]|nr:isoleucine--tRNA ligase [bacterium]